MMLTPEEFSASARENVPPDRMAVLPGPLQALWHDARGDWDAAHALVQSDDSNAAAWVHAYLHRKEGDESNAGYWYARARKPKPDAPLDEEWRAIVSVLLQSVKD